MVHYDALRGLGHGAENLMTAKLGKHEFQVVVGAMDKTLNYQRFQFWPQRAASQMMRSRGCISVYR
jgi:hypothetical protein